MASLCKNCEEIQEQLLADNEGTGGQITCNHQDDQTIMVIEDEEGEDGESSSGVSTFSSVAAAAVDMKSKPRDNRKRKFQTMKTFAEAGDDDIKRKVVPIEKWTSLKVKELFRVKRVISMNVIIKKKKQLGFYAELEDANEELKNVWLTDIIKKELDTYSLAEGNTYIMPLGPTESKESGNMYHNFVIQDIKEEMI